MADFNKSFNFRGGFQVDEDVFIVRGQQVGIGTTLPSARLDVDGTIRAKSLDIRDGNGATLDTLDVGIITAGVFNSGIVSISNGIITSTDSNAGLVTYYGDGRFLEGLPTSQWIDIDVGLGFTSIYSAGFVGVNTNDPRYVFQVGGAPFGSVIGIGTSFGQQTGVAIYNGRVEASGLITTRGSIQAGGEFIGVGSNITILNADNIGVGSIGSMRYGDLIVTKEVIADRFIGTATSADSLEPGVKIEIEQITVSGLATVNGDLQVNGEIYAGAGVSVSDSLKVGNDLDVIDDVTVGGGVISTDGYKTVGGIIQVGTDTINADSSDIEIVKSGDASVIAISTQGLSQVLVGDERYGVARRGYGGIRRGGSVLDPLSLSDDLDVVNYDIGNLNFYLHAGVGGITEGDFRWINGQTDQVLASLSNTGTFTVPSNGVDDIQVVVGSGLTADSIITKDLTVSANATFSGNTVLDGDVSFTGDVSIDDIDIESLTVESIVASTVTTRTTTITGESIIINNANDNNTTVITDDNLNTESVSAVNGQFTTLTATNTNSINYTNPNSSFIVDVDGKLTASHVSVGSSVTANSGYYDSLTVTNGGRLSISTFGDIRTPEINVSDLLFVSGNTSISTVTCGTLQASGIATLPTLESTTASITDLTVSNSLTLSSFSVTDIDVNTINPGTGNTVTIAGDLDLGSNELKVDDVTATGIVTCGTVIASSDVVTQGIVAGVGDTVFCDSDFSASALKTFGGTTHAGPGITTTNVAFEFSGGNLVVKVTDSDGNNYQGTVTLTPVP